MLEAAFFRHDGIPGNPLDRRLDRISFEVSNTNGVPREDGHLAVAEEEDVAGVLQNRRNIGSNKKFAIAQTNYNRRTLAHRDDRARSHARGQIAQ